MDETTEKLCMALDAAERALQRFKADAATMRVALLEQAALWEAEGYPVRAAKIRETVRGACAPEG